MLFILIGSALAIFQGVGISRPLRVLAWRANQIAGGDLDARVVVKSNNEIGRLGANFNAMADRIVVLLEEAAEKVLLEKELELARTIQETLVPGSEPIERGRLSFAGINLRRSVVVTGGPIRISRETESCS
jgi:sigma-B regulation protein RsbU (phosphoserine phosphatase)